MTEEQSESRSAIQVVLAVLAGLAMLGCGNSSGVNTATTAASKTDWPEDFDSSLEYYGDNIFASMPFDATPESCADQFEVEPPGSPLEYFDAVTTNSCYQRGAIPFPPPMFDCADGTAPDAPDERDALAGGMVIFDIRSREVMITSHVLEQCIPLGPKSNG